jgi:hypothetical protein
MAATGGTASTDHSPERSHHASWIRRTTEPCDQRPADIVVLVVSTIGVGVSGLWAQAVSGIDLIGRLSSAP